MANNEIARILIAGGMAASVVVPGVASAIDFNITGFVRQEISYSITDNENEFNQSGNVFNGAIVPAATIPGVSTAKWQPYLFGPNITASRANAVAQGLPAGLGNFTATCGAGAGCDANGDGVGEVGAALTQDIPFNAFNTRAELDIQAKFSPNIDAYLKIRAYFDGTSAFSDAHLSKAFLADGDWGGGRGTVLEIQNNDAMIDLPSFYFDFNYGSLWARVGQQQIAWGEALFFRVLDVPNGLDVRRHLFTDVAAEEYADERVAAPGVRVSYTFTNGWEIDAFAQLFNPSILPNTNTPYNVIPAAFTLESGDEFDDVKGAMNFGMRVSAPVTDALTLQAIAVSRRNPDGVVRWDDAPTVNPDGTPNPFCMGPNNFAGFTTPLPDGRCGSFFNQDGTATASYAEWFHYAGRTRLNPVDGVATSVAEAPASFPLRAGFGIIDNPDGTFSMAPGAAGKQSALTTLDAFFTGFGPLRGYITREFKREQIFGFAANYIITAEPASLFDQLIVRGEVSYTPDKKFTDLRLSKVFIEEDEIAASIVLEKYQSLFDAIPATYMIVEWMHKTESDLFGRHLSGNDNRGLQDTDGRPDGQDQFNAVTFAFQQPFPNLIWRLDFAVLIDVAGGWFMQPGLRYKPSSDWQFDLYANIAQDGGGKNNDTLETIDFSDEIMARVTFYF